MSDLISRSKVIAVLEQLEEHSLTGKIHISNAIYLLENQPTAYDIDNVVEELEKNKRKLFSFAKDYDEVGNSEMAEIYSDRASEYVNAIEIVKQGGVADDVCEWKAGKSNDEWHPNCEPNSTYNVFGVAWFRKCPYCGKKIKVVK